jgi:hypothetical protein
VQAELGYSYKVKEEEFTGCVDKDLMIIELLHISTQIVFLGWLGVQQRLPLLLQALPVLHLQHQN